MTKNPFDGISPIVVYTADQAIEDGILAELPGDGAPPPTSDPRFELGRVIATPGVVEAIERQTLFSLINRHQSGDWGDLDNGDKRENDRALKHGDRILSNYKVGDEAVWIITEHDRSVTTCLFPREY